MARKKRFKEKKITFLPWPANCSDINPIENLWVILTRSVYAEGRQFETVSDIKKATIYALDDLNVVTRTNLAKSKPGRLIELLEKRSAETYYALRIIHFVI